MSQERDKLRNEIFWLATLIHSALGTCDRLRTCSSAEKNKRLIGFGYNGSLDGNPHCDDAGHEMVQGHCVRTLHGETNLRRNAGQENIQDSTVRIIATPCFNCMKDDLISSGVKTILYTGEYDNGPGKELVENMALRNDVLLEHVDIDWLVVIQDIFDRLSQKGGAFHNLGYRLKIIKEEIKK